jgi:hypothetical protein
MATSRVFKKWRSFKKYLLEAIRAIITVLDTLGIVSVEGLHRPGGYHGEVLSPVKYLHHKSLRRTLLYVVYIIIKTGQ